MGVGAPEGDRLPVGRERRPGVVDGGIRREIERVAALDALEEHVLTRGAQVV
jgi:hypothetical protein